MARSKLKKLGILSCSLLLLLLPLNVQAQSSRIDDPKSLVAYHRLNSNIDDYSGYGNDHTATGDVVYVSTTWGSTGYDFGGDDDRIGVIDVGNTKSVTFWINPDTTTEEIMKFTASSGVKINVSSGTIGTTGWTSPTVYVNGLVSSTLVADKWQFVAITSATAFDASQTTLGWSDAGYGDLSLAEVRMYNCTLTDEEIQYLHEMNLPSN